MPSWLHPFFSFLAIYIRVVVPPGVGFAVRRLLHGWRAAPWKMQRRCPRTKTDAIGPWLDFLRWWDGWFCCFFFGGGRGSIQKTSTRWWLLKDFLCSPRTLGKMIPFWRAYFSDGLKCWNHQLVLVCVFFLGGMGVDQKKLQKVRNKFLEWGCYFSRKTFRRRVLQKIVGVSHTTHIPHISHTTHIPHISITPHISHTYPFKTYPTNTYPTNTYPTNTYPFNTYPTSTYPCNAYPFKTFASAGFAIRIPPIRIPPIRIRSTRIPPIRIHAMRIHMYPFNAYPFKRCASAGIATVSHQYISHQYVSSTWIPPVRIHSMRIHSKSLHQQEWQWVWVSLHIISYHCYSAGMVMNIETLLFLQFLCKIINWI